MKNFSSFFLPKMIFFSCLAFCAISIKLFAEQEIYAVTHLIEATKKNLDSQLALKEKMQRFIEQKEKFRLGEHTKNLAFLMVQNASEIRSIIAEHHLEYLFTSQYLEELAFFSLIAHKKTPTRP